MRPKVIVILGATATGKTALSVDLALRIDGEVISADSRQVYKGLDIGSGKVTFEEMRGVPHHLLDVADPREVFSAGDFLKQGRVAISDILKRGKVPIIVGGTGLYIDVLLGNVSIPEIPADPAFRSRLSEYSLEELNARLKKLDPERAEMLDTKNRVRVERALEIAEKSPGAWKLKSQNLYDTLYIGLTLPSDELKENIRVRLIARMESGLVEEVKKLHEHGLSFERFEELGLEYRYLGRYLRGMLTREEMLTELEKEIRRYAKRQMTWFNARSLRSPAISS